MRLVHRGKVRDVYELDDRRLVLVATDRLSAFDVVMQEPVPDKGRVLTAMSAFWFELLRGVGPNHVVAYELDDAPDSWRGRTMVVRKADMLPIECIVRGYLSGSAWREYRASGTVHGSPAPAGLVEAARLEAPLFTPSTKAASGSHDENISYEQAAQLVGSSIAEQARTLCLDAYVAAASYAEARGVIIADTKFELGFVDGRLVFADEVLTPDSSRFWERAVWAPGSTPPSYDKQPVRDYLDTLDWDKKPPPPPLPPEIVAATRERYQLIYERLSERALAAWPG